LVNARSASFIYGSATLLILMKRIFGRYLLVGLVNTLIYSCILWLFLSHSVVPYPLSVAFAFLIAMVFQYLANKYFTFRIIPISLREIFRYLLAALLNYAASVLVIWASLDLFKTSTLLASLFSAATSAFLGFTVSFFWVYQK